jgi:hypothetical protein
LGGSLYWAPKRNEGQNGFRDDTQLQCNRKEELSARLTRWIVEEEENEEEQQTRRRSSYRWVVGTQQPHAQ